MTGDINLVDWLAGGRKGGEAIVHRTGEQKYTSVDQVKAISEAWDYKGAHTFF